MNFQALQVLLHHADMDDNDVASIITERDRARANRDKVLVDLKAALAFKREANAEKRRLEDLLVRSDKK